MKREEIGREITNKTQKNLIQRLVSSALHDVVFAMECVQC